MKLHVLTAGAALALLGGAGLAIAQGAAPTGQTARPTTVEGFMAAAKRAAGTEWGNVAMATCIAPTPTAAPVTTPAPAPATPPRANWYAPPAKIADNFYFLGTRNHSSFALVASNGESIIIDNLFEYAPRSTAQPAQPAITPAIVARCSAPSMRCATRPVLRPACRPASGH